MPMLRTKALERLAQLDERITSFLYACQRFTLLVTKPEHQEKLQNFQKYFEIVGVEIDELQFGLSVRPDLLRLGKATNQQIKTLVLNIMLQSTKLGLLFDEFSPEFGGLAQF